MVPTHSYLEDRLNVKGENQLVIFKSFACVTSFEVSETYYCERTGEDTSKSGSFVEEASV